VANGGSLTVKGGPVGDSLAALHARLLRDRSLQFDFTALQEPRPLHEPAWLRALGDWLGRVVGAALPALKIVFWAGVAAAVLLVVWLIVREVAAVRFARRRRARAARPTPADWRPDARKARALLENADRLAAIGRYDQAVRLILHRGVEDIDARRPAVLRPALTARDIAALPVVPAPARNAFARIAAIVEFSAFAGQPIGQDAFAQCRAAYEAFVAPEAWA
jgi:hypothetical protein